MTPTEQYEQKVPQAVRDAHRAEYLRIRDEPGVQDSVLKAHEWGRQDYRRIREEYGVVFGDGTENHQMGSGY